MSIRQILCVAGLVLTVLPTWSQTSSPANPLSLSQALQAARDNLEVAMARQAVASARADIVSADRAPFPTLSAGISGWDLQNGNGDGNVLTEKRLDKAIGLDWTWERGNKRALRTQGAKRTAEAAQADLDEARTQQQLAALSSFFDLLGAQERSAEVAQIEHSATSLARSATTRLNAGDLSAQDVARIEIEARRAASDLQQAELERQRQALSLWQVTGIGLAPEQLIASNDWPLLDTPPLSTPAPESLVDTRPDVLAARARLQAAQSALEFANAQKSADVTWGASYDHLPGTSTALLALRMSMPLQTSYRFEGEIARAAAQLTQAEQLLEKTRRLAKLELQRLQREVQTAAMRAKSYQQDILPRARLVSAGAELAYSKGAIGLTDLLDARRTLRATLLDALAARTDYAKAIGAWQLRTQTAGPQQASAKQP